MLLCSLKIMDTIEVKIQICLTDFCTSGRVKLFKSQNFRTQKAIFGKSQLITCLDFPKNSRKVIIKFTHENQAKLLDLLSASDTKHRLQTSDHGLGVTFEFAHMASVSSSMQLVSGCKQKDFLNDSRRYNLFSELLTMYILCTYFSLKVAFCSSCSNNVYLSLGHVVHYHGAAQIKAHFLFRK